MIGIDIHNAWYQRRPLGLDATGSYDGRGKFVASKAGELQTPQVSKPNGELRAAIPTLLNIPEGLHASPYELRRLNSEMRL